MQRPRRAGAVMRRRLVAGAMLAVCLAICVGDVAGLEESLLREKVPMERGEAQGVPTGKVRRFLARSHSKPNTLYINHLVVTASPLPWGASSDLNYESPAREALYSHRTSPDSRTSLALEVLDQWDPAPRA